MSVHFLLISSPVVPDYPGNFIVDGGGFVNGSTQFSYPGDGIVNTSQAIVSLHPIHLCILVKSAIFHPKDMPVIYVNFNYRLGVYGCSF